VETKRTNRSSKPEVVYYISRVETKKVITDQVRSPILTRHTKHETRSASAGPSDVRNPVTPGATPQVAGSSQARRYNCTPPAPTQQLVIQAPLDPDEQEDEQTDEEEDEVFTDTEDMTENKTIDPGTFSGTTGEDGDRWLKHFEHYCAYKGYPEGKQLALCKVLLTGSAVIWLDTSEKINSITTFKTEFNKSYKIPEIIKYRSAKKIFSRRQREDECADDYISYMRKLATNVRISDNKVIQYAILNGFRTHIAAYVTQQKSESLEAVLEAARTAEVTMPAGPSVGPALSDQLADVQAEVRRLSMKWDKMTTAPVFENRTPSSSPSPPARHVTFAQPQGMRLPQARTSY